MCLLLNMWKSDEQQVRIIFLFYQSHEYVCSEWLCQNLSTLWMKLLLPDYFIDCLRVKCDFNNDRSTENKWINITRHSLGFLSVLLIHMWHKDVKFNMQFHMWPLDAANDHMLQLEAHKVQSLLQLMLRHSVLWKPNNEIHFLKNWFHRLVFYIWASKVTKKNTKNLWFLLFLPSLKSVTVRSNWSQIYSQRITKEFYDASCEGQTGSNKHAVVVGTSQLKAEPLMSCD